MRNDISFCAIGCSGRLVYSGNGEAVSFLSQESPVDEPKMRSLLGHVNPFDTSTPYFMNSFAADAVLDSRGIGRDQYEYSEAVRYAL